jgi:two-component system phosphate regulon response regulator PhoB
VRGTVFEYDNFSELQQHLSAIDSERDFALQDASEVRDGEWLLATFKVGEESTSLAGCVIDIEGERRLSFEERDWNTLWRFAAGTAPRSLAPEARERRPTTVRPPPNCSVLVVDDDSDVQQVVAAVLEAKGFEARVVTSAEEALDELRETPAKLVIVDFDLPGMTGIEFCRRLRGDGSLGTTPVLFLTAHNSQGDILEAFAAGADDFVPKPFRAHELGARIMGLVGRCPGHAAEHATR